MRSPLSRRRMSDPGRKPLLRKAHTLDLPRNNLHRRQSTGMHVYINVCYGDCICMGVSECMYGCEHMFGYVRVCVYVGM